MIIVSIMRSFGGIIIQVIVLNGQGGDKYLNQNEMKIDSSKNIGSLNQDNEVSARQDTVVEAVQ